MADWSQLPPELITLIAKCLEKRFDVLRFRSVCSSWRSSSFPPKLYPLPKYLPSQTWGSSDFFIDGITRDTFFLVRFRGANKTAAACWVVNNREYTKSVNWRAYTKSVKMMRLLKPLSNSELMPLPVSFPKVLDLTNFQVTELGHQFFVQYDAYFDHPLEPRTYALKSKAAFLRSNSNSNDFIMLTILRDHVPYVAFRLSGQTQSTLLENAHKGVDDIISFNGKFYLIEGDGRTIVVDNFLNISFIKHVGSPTSRKYLVQSGDNLLAVEMLNDRFGSVSDEDEDEDVVCFKIFRLDEEEQKWDEMESLGDQVLFIGSYQSTSASASEFYLEKGNLIFYSRYGRSDSEYTPMFVFDLDTGTASPLENCPAYRSLFWPPPEWVNSSESVIPSREVISNSTSSESVIPSSEVKRNSTSSVTSEVVYFDSDFTISDASDFSRSQ